MKNHKIFEMSFASVYPYYVEKAEKKGRTKKEVDEIICWLTGYNQESLEKQIDCKIDFEEFFNEVPEINPNASKITGSVCGHKVQDIEHPLMKKIRYLDKLIDELAKGKSYGKDSKKIEYFITQSPYQVLSLI